MKTLLTRLFATIAFTFIALGASPALHAEDIDIFGGAGGGALPNVLFVIDSRASNDATVNPYTCGYAPLPNGTMLQMIQCGLYMAFQGINSQPALSGKFSAAVMVAGKNNTSGAYWWWFPRSPPPYGFTKMDTSGVAAITPLLEDTGRNTGIKTDGNGYAWVTRCTRLGHSSLGIRDPRVFRIRPPSLGRRH